MALAVPHLMLLDAWMPDFDVRSAHAIDVDADARRVFDALLVTDFSRNPVVRLLMGIRAVPLLLVAPRTAWAQWHAARQIRLGDPVSGMLDGAFVRLELDAPVEIVFGLTGRFWTPTGGLVPSDPVTFRDDIPAGMARAAWNFRFEPLSASTSRLTTETRVRCADDRTRRRFAFYWHLIHPGSGIIRWALLRQIRTAAAGD